MKPAGHGRIDPRSQWTWNFLARTRDKIGKPRLVAVEVATFVPKATGAKALLSRGMIHGAIRHYCRHVGVPLLAVSVAAAKQRLAGTGNATKDAMIAAARTLGHTPETHDAADALAVLLVALDRMESRA